MICRTHLRVYAVVLLVLVSGFCVVPHALAATLYAGTSGPGAVFRYAGGTTWEPASGELGFAVLCLAEYQGSVYAGTMSSAGVGQIYQYDGGSAWTLVGDGMDGQVASLAVYGDELYAGTAGSGAHLYRYDGGTAWTLVVDYIASWGGIRSLHVASDGWLYLGDIGYDYIARFDGTSVHDAVYLGGSCIYDFAEYNGSLYAAAWAGRLITSPNGTSWSTALYYDSYMWEVEPFQGQLYMAHQGGELRRMDSGGAGETVHTNTYPIISMVADGDSELYFGTGAEAGYYGGSYGSGHVYSFDGDQVQLITSEALGVGVQCLALSSVEAGPPAVLLRGNLHSHSTVSDARRIGLWNPSAPDIVGDYAGSAFLGVGDGPQVWALTDHYPDISAGEWDMECAAAHTASALAMYGFEWSAPAPSYAGPHINVIGPSECPGLAEGPRIERTSDLFRWLEGTGAVGQFNHPDNPVFGWTVQPPASYGGDTPSLVEKMALFEVGSGFYQFDKYGLDRSPLRWVEHHLGGEAYTDSLAGYLLALLAGWRVGATNNQDNHMYFLDRWSGEWKGPSNHTGIWVRDPSRQGVLGALRRRWVFASEDWGFRLSMSANGQFMGSSGVAPEADGRLYLSIEAFDDDEPVGFVAVLTGPSGGGDAASLLWYEHVAASAYSPTFDFGFTSGHWYLVIIEQDDGDLIVSSPVWTE